MFARWNILWHGRVRGHSQTTNTTLTTHVADMFSKGWLVKCECGKIWAL